MGAAAAKCSEIVGGNSNTVNAAKALEEEEEAEEEEADEDEADAEEEAAEAARKDAQDALKGGIVRGKTTAFREAIDHATSLGIDENMILKAEAALDDHKKTREREAFSEELAAFLETEESHEIEPCEEILKKGEGISVTESVLKQLRDRIEDINLSRDLEEEELAKANAFVTSAATKWVASCLKGRSCSWVNMANGKKEKALCLLDPAMRKLSVVQEGDRSELCSCMLASAMACGAAGHAKASGSSGFGKLKDEEQDCSIALNDKDGNGPWLLCESALELQVEFLLALAVLGGGNGDDVLSSSKNLKTSMLRNSSKSGGDAPAAPETGEDGEGFEGFKEVEGGGENEDKAMKDDKKDKKEKAEKKDKKEKKSKK
mmetsp:Transcript_693/g.1187  ORF Transcript_693/g.1187 Transcript_693/m.1187 type:complete len:375 (+) Transcript_693:28-1152(+)|eukprot:CAMPEP_0197661720 /NCGR_PEP_ID=MMETSP1338-20131121/51625_1 /TAXON_ID=43686 ORGANISM="Pelagodinium beii, Strain RCC1491" /NCGR_SAMPLE_ID=MMETSP1338 /ASSEMBLY_ACC=CAM_ASM_000754 /LENGTH=374 /DNA_ID=CAMNT_0043239327 /DNA_START=22 /DNA_END=1146 /DNA_ORIENTATION=+